MSTYFQLLKQNGLKFWGTFLLGYLAVITIDYIVTLIVMVLGFLILFGGAAIGTQMIDSLSSSPEAIFTAIGAPGFLIGYFLFLLMIILTSSFFLSYYYAGSFSMVNEVVLDGSTSMATFFNSGFRYWIRMFWLSCLSLLLGLLVLIPVFLIDLTSLLFDNSSVILIYLIIEYIIGFILLSLLGLSLLFAPVIMTAENKGAWESIRLSINIFRKSFGKVFVTALGMIVTFGVPVILFLGAIFTLFTISEAAPELEVVTLIMLIGVYILFYLSSPFLQAASILIASLRYKMYFRPMVVPAAYETPEDHPPHDKGSTEGGTLPDHLAQPAATKEDVEKSAEFPSSPDKQEPIKESPSSEEKTEKKPTDDSEGVEKPEETDQPKPPPSYPRFPTDPYIK
ncbi:hypothetical protein GXN76_05775 [Kroppenstedtia pulmonis]|uniref:Glycerophosphoryl diester phosphodiesterase membrane domain-containing protein n=1 Tax=Kroppenstedtia pulmonis TaxID=1380685 RepID=A0A7D3XR56_9BACL|nr:hypothetical protein [Kroppenstedtia pulmonis]QKG84028.1 hypothetical protein GXN76_05775 [Kroppenstedtia pulmonis]